MGGIESFRGLTEQKVEHMPGSYLRDAEAACTAGAVYHDILFCEFFRPGKCHFDSCFQIRCATAATDGLIPGMRWFYQMNIHSGTKAPDGILHLG